MIEARAAENTQRCPSEADMSLHCIFEAKRSPKQKWLRIASSHLETAMIAAQLVEVPLSQILCFPSATESPISGSCGCFSTAMAEPMTHKTSVLLIRRATRRPSEHHLLPFLVQK